MSEAITVEAGCVCKSSYMPDGSNAVDVDVTVTLPDGSTVEGEVTLLPAEDPRSPGYSSWGVADNWVCGRLLADLYAAEESGSIVLRDALSEIAAVAGRAADSEAP